MNDAMGGMLDQIKESIIANESSTCKGLYIEIEMISDIELQSLMNMVDERQLNHILENMNHYSGRVDKQITKYFPELNILDLEVTENITSTEHPEELFIGAPHREFHDTITPLITDITHDNRCKFDHNSFTDLNLHFNCKYVEIPIAIQQLITKEFQQYIPRGTITFSHGNTGDHPKSLMQRFDIFFIYYTKDWINGNSTKKLVEEEDFYGEKKMMCMVELDFDPYTKTPDQLDEIMKNTQVIYDTFCKFVFIDNNLL